MPTLSYRDIEPVHYEWAWLGRQAAVDPAAFTEYAAAEGLREPETFTAEVMEIGNTVSWDIALAHTGLVKSIANRYAPSVQRSACLDVDDLISEGTLGVYRSAGKYHPFRNTLTPGSFFSRAINNAVRRTIDDQSTTVRLPVNARDALRRVDRFRNYRDPFTGHGISQDRAFELAGVTSDKARKRIEQARLLTYEMGSIDNGFSPRVPDPSESDYSPQMESVFSEGQDDDITAAETDIRAKDIRIVFDGLSLPERKHYILRARLGFDIDGGTQDPLTLEQVGLALGISGNRVRQIEALALGSLRDPKTAEKFCPSERVQYEETLPGRERKDGTRIPPQTITHTYWSRIIE